MMDYLSSMYIDNEMDLDEKKQFVEKVRSDQAFYTQTLELLVQEQQLQVMHVVVALTDWNLTLLLQQLVQLIALQNNQLLSIVEPFMMLELQTLLM